MFYKQLQPPDILVESGIVGRFSAAGRIACRRVARALGVPTFQFNETLDEGSAGSVVNLKTGMLDVLSAVTCNIVFAFAMRKTKGG